MNCFYHRYCDWKQERERTNTLLMWHGIVEKKFALRVIWFYSRYQQLMQTRYGLAQLNDFNRQVYQDICRVSALAFRIFNSSSNLLSIRVFKNNGSSLSYNVASLPISGNLVCSFISTCSFKFGTGDRLLSDDAKSLLYVDTKLSKWRMNLTKDVFDSSLTDLGVEIVMMYSKNYSLSIIISSVVTIRFAD